MVIKVETQDRVRHLLKEALPMLCRSGLSFESEFSVEALIGITLKNDVFLVSIKETVKSETGDGDDKEKSLEVSVTKAGSEETPSQKRRPHRKRRRSKSSPSKNTHSDSDEDDTTHTDDYDDASDIKREKLDVVGSIADYDNTGSVQTGSDTNATSCDIKTRSLQDDDDDDDESNDAIIVKTEPAETDFSSVSFSDVNSGHGYDMSGYPHPLASSTMSSPQSAAGTSYGQAMHVIPNANQQGAEGQPPGAQGSMRGFLPLPADPQPGFLPLPADPQPGFLPAPADPHPGFLPVPADPQERERLAKFKALDSECVVVLPGVGYQCVYCKHVSMAKTKKAIRDHVLSAHLNTLYACVCDCTFKWKVQLWNHRKVCAEFIRRQAAQNQ